MEIKLLIGLGNPGKEFENTYHNVGQLFIDYLARKDAKFKRAEHFEYSRTNDLMANNSMTLVKPLTFMNQSGGAVTAAKKYFKVKTSEFLIVHDDSDIPLGSFKLSYGRGSAGHQGIESIIKSLQTKNFYRLRIGIRPSKETQRKKANELVLKKIPAKERKIINDLFRSIGAEINGKAYPAAGLRRNS